MIFSRAVSEGKMPFIFSDFTDLPMVSLDGICRVDHPPNLGCEIKIDCSSRRCKQYRNMRQDTDRCGKSVYQRIFTGSDISAFKRAKGVRYIVLDLWSGN